MCPNKNLYTHYCSAHSYTVYSCPSCGVQFLMRISLGGATTAFLSDLPAKCTACTAMLVYTLFLSSPVKL